MNIPNIILIQETIDKYGYDPTYFKGSKDYKKKVVRTCFICNNIYDQQFENVIRSVANCKKCKYCANKERSINNAENNSKLIKDKIKNGTFIPPMLGRKHSDEMKKNASNRLKGKSFEELYGKEKSDIIKVKLSKNKSGENNPFYGKKHTDEVIRFITDNSIKTTKRGKESNFYGKNYNEIINNDIFIDQCKENHGDVYDYSETNYTGSYNKINVICKKHGIFSQIANTHKISRCGCPKCNKSKGEIEISKNLDILNIEYIEQYRFKGCLNKQSLPFDFYLPSKNICIEYDGNQHFKPNSHFGGIDGFIVRSKNDKIKSEYCELNNIKLIRIPYYNFNDIKDILDKEL